ncbi:unnamed protein product, partial [Brassica oleracea]
RVHPKTLLDTRIEKPPQVPHLDAGGVSGRRRRHLSSYVFFLLHYDLVFYCFLAKSFIHSHLFGASSSSDLAVERPDSTRKSSSQDIRGIPSLVYASSPDFSANSPSFTAASPDTSLSLASHHYQEVTKALFCETSPETGFAPCATLDFPDSLDLQTFSLGQCSVSPMDSISPSSGLNLVCSRFVNALVTITPTCVSLSLSFNRNITALCSFLSGLYPASFVLLWEDYDYLVYLPLVAQVYCVSLAGNRSSSLFRRTPKPLLITTAIRFSLVILKFTVSSWSCLCLKNYSFVESFSPVTENQVYFVATRLPFSFLGEMSKLCVEAYEVSLRNGTIRLCSSTSSLLQDGCALKVLSEGLPYYPRDFVTSLVTISGLEASCVLASLHGILTHITNIDVDNRGLLYVLCGICVKIASIYHDFTLCFAFVATFPLAILAVFSVVWNLYSIFG